MVIFSFFLSSIFYFFFALTSIGLFSSASLKGYAVFFLICVIFELIFRRIEDMLQKWNSTRRVNVNIGALAIAQAFTLIAFYIATRSWEYFK